MTRNKDCPDSQELLQLINEQVSAIREIQLVEHVDQCQRCQVRLDQMAAEPDLFKDVGRSDSNPNDDRPYDAFELNEALRLLNPSKLNSSSTNTVFDLVESSFDEKSSGLTLIERVGRGGMGVVVKAIDNALNRPVAVKFMSPLFDGDKNARARFIREARAAAGISHSNIVTIHSVCDQEPYPYLTMEFVSGVSLQSLVEGKQLGGFKKIIDIGRQLASGLSAAHEIQVVHRDIKPENILLDARTGQVKITDFGLARVLDEAKLTQTGVFMGSPGFQAPEVLDGNVKIEHRCDLFSLGCVLYYMCAGRPPFPTNALIVALQKAASGDFRPIEEVKPDVPSAFAQVINQLLQPDRENRIQSAHEVVQKLDAVELQSKVPPPPPVPHKTNQELVDLKNATQQNDSIVVNANPGSKVAARPQGLPSSKVWFLGVAAMATLLIGWFVVSGLLGTKDLGDREKKFDDSELAARKTARESQINSPKSSGLEKSSTKKKSKEKNNNVGKKLVPKKRIRSKELTNQNDQDLAVFSLISSGKSVKFRTLNEAVKEADEGDTVLIDSSDTFELFETIEIERDIKIVAATNQRPTLAVYLASNDEEETKPFLHAKSDLFLSGIDIRLNEVEDGDAVMVLHEQGSLQFENCRFYAQGESTCVMSESATQAGFENCEFYFGLGCGLEITLDQKGSIQLVNCLLAGKVATRIDSDFPTRIEMESCTTVCERFAELHGEAEERIEQVLFDFQATQCVMATVGCVFLIEEEWSAMSRIKSFMKWKGESNLFVNPCICFFDDDDDVGEAPHWCNDFASWKNVFAEQGSKQESDPFPTPMKQLVEEWEESTFVGPEYFRVNNGSDATVGYQSAFK